MVEDKIWIIYEVSVYVNEMGDELIFIFWGDGFLYKMIWILVGMLLKIGNGWLELIVILVIIVVKDWNLVGLIVYLEGLYLVEVKYEN